MANEEGACGKGRWEEISHLNQVGTIRWREGKKEGKKKKRGVRRSTFSLGFMKIGLSVFVEKRGKVHLRDESFVYVQESEVFSKLQEVGVFFLLWLVLV